MGFPTAPIVTIAFKDLAKSNAASRGMPLERITFTPHPLTNKTDAEMYAVLEGNDPVTGKNVMKEIVEALTVPLTAEEQKTGTISPDVGPPTYTDTADNLQRMYADNNMTDYMPIILPTEARVAAMLKGTSHSPDEMVGKLSPAKGAFPEWSYNVRQVAINAVMAGAQPEYLPVILAIASTGQPSLFSSTSSFARMVVVNGPIRDQLKMNYGIGAMGPFNDANATIGRAWTILSKNLGGCGMPGQTYMGTHGTSLNYNNIFFPETEDKLPEGWTPLHVQHGYKKEESVVSILSGWSLNNICYFPTSAYDELIKNWMTHFFSTGNGSATLVLDPTVADDVKAHGHATKEAFADYLMKETKTPSWFYWDSQFNRKYLDQAKAGVEPYASYLKMGPDADLPISRYARRATPGNAGGSLSGIEVIVMGGSTNTYWLGGDFSYLTSASVDKWK
jgi:hypothetical protein